MDLAIKIVLISLCPFFVECQVLNPPHLNLAENKKIVATSTCGEQNGRPLKEMYCFLAGATSYDPLATSGLHHHTVEQNQYFAELRLGGGNSNDGRHDLKNVVEGGQNCQFCDSSVADFSHPAEYMVDGTLRWWQSPPLSRGMEFNQVNITIDLEQEFHVSYVLITMANSPRPGLWVLERSTDYGKTYQPWQYFAESPSQCEEFFGPDALQPILDDDSVICTTEHSQIVPLENGEIYVTLLTNRPSRANFSHSEKLQKFTQATNIRIRLLRTKTLQGHLMDLNDKKDPTITRRYFYAIKEIQVSGRCVCHGHAKTCDILDLYRPNRLLCRCEHNTCGDQCDKCCPGYEQKQWQPTREGQIFDCEPCNCYGHSSECEYNKTVDEMHLSLDINGNFIGGGVCKNCRDNTAGINCNKCAFGYFRPYDQRLDVPDSCKPCECSPYYHTGACADGNGECECRPNFVQPGCRKCAIGYHNYPECRPCDCNVNGTLNDVCLPEDGSCPCKPNYSGTFCSQCIDGTYSFPDCLGCVCEDRGALDKNCSKSDGQCQCKLNYGGKNCELCADGYFSHPECNYCNCDSSGTEKSICDKATGTCLCKPGFAGDRCDRCNDTHFGYPDCKPCLCDLTGSNGESCNGVSGQCVCKPNFTGRQCNKCIAGYYGYPRCLACECDRSGSRGITCNNNGVCPCKPTFDGPKCNRCKPNHYNYPVCEECNCDPRGVSQSFLGCDKVPPGELCSCKERVTGRICNECKPTFWNLQYFNQFGCEDCGCHLPGTLSGLSDCDDVGGQCQCKAHVSGRNCTECRNGFYNLQQFNQFGCQPCTCDIGGSFSGICDGKTGQCRCKPRINGRNCTTAIEMHYFPTLLHMQYEAEDGRTLDNNHVRYAIDPELFPNFSWKGFAVFSPIQDEILLDIDIAAPNSVYRLVLRYVNPTANDLTVTAELIPSYTRSHEDVKQTVEFKLQPSKEPKSFVISKAGSPYPFVLSPGRWTLHIKTQQRLFLDYVSLLPSAYFEGNVLRHDVRNPCLLDDAPEGSCKRYAYPPVNHTKLTVGGMYLEENGAKQLVPTHMDEKIINKHGQIALLQGDKTYYADVNLPKPGNYVVVIDYANFVSEVFPAKVDVQAGDTKFSGIVSFHHCPYSEFCREVVSSNGGEPLKIYFSDNGGKISVLPGPNTNVAVGSIVAIPYDDWKVDYLLPKPFCIMRNGKCHGSDFLLPSNSLRFDVETHGNQNFSVFAEHLPFEVANDGTVVAVLDANHKSIDVSGKVGSPDYYIFVVHYYNPKFAHVDLDALIQNDHFYETTDVNLANAFVPISFCPSVSGCRTVIKRKGDGAMTFQINERFIASLFLKNEEQQAYIDYILTVPLNNYASDVLEPISGERSAEYLNKCSHLLLETDPQKFDEYCKSKVFSLTADYNHGAFSCDCTGDGSTSFQCDSFGGQCPCKPNVIGRRCETCAPGYFGFPDCRPCNCLRSQQCDPHTGQCFCPLHVEGQQCDRCVPYAFGYDPLIGCQECKCNNQGTHGGTIECDQLTGQCRCKEHVGERKCDKCVAGFYGFPHCYQCSCELAGSSVEICDQNTATCSCKENVFGQSCESCVAGTFHLEERNPKGCTECFCFGVTSQCQSSIFVKNPLYNMREWTMINSQTPNAVEVQSVAEFAPTNGAESPVAPAKSIYFSAPASYLGKLLFSYGGKLSYTLTLPNADKTGQNRTVAPDVILKGQNETIEHWADNYPDDSTEDFQMSVDILPEKWRKEGGGLVSRPLLMLVLNKVTAVYIKASYYERTTNAKLSRVLLDSAIEERNRVGDVAANVESCFCPAGYTGTSCEECLDGYYRVLSGSFLGSCVPCQCNSHANLCDKATGKCFDCRDNTVGEHCELCASGYHGDPSRGHPLDCQLCACPHPTLENNFATSCSVAESGHVRSCECKPEYAGINCERCAIGFYGDPMRRYDTCKPCFCNQNNNLTIPAACDPYSGVCSLCERNTMGNACEICATWFYGDAVEQKNCQKCTCDQCNSYLCEDKTGVCQCKPNVEGQNCDRCVANAYDFKSCRGCRMCDCGIASISPQCNSDTGKCDCQFGAVGDKCNDCEQGYWNYKETGCTKCDCEADLSLGTVCDVRTGQCHCMDGATGPRCDQCIEHYLRVPKFGCRFCDFCVHVLVADLDSLEIGMQRAEAELAGVSTVYLTNQRLARFNETVLTLKPLAKQIMNTTAESAANAVKSSISAVKAATDDILIKGNRINAGFKKNEDRAKQLEADVTTLDQDANKVVTNVHNVINGFVQLATTLGQQEEITTQRREQLISEATRFLDQMKNYNFADLEQKNQAKMTDAEKLHVTSLEKAKSNAGTKDRLKNVTDEAHSFDEKLKEHAKHLDLLRLNKSLTENIQRGLKAHPYYNGISFDSAKDQSNQNVQNGNDYIAKTKVLLFEMHDIYNSISETLKSNSSRNASIKYEMWQNELPVLQSLKYDTEDKASRLEYAAARLKHQISGVKADSDRAVQAAESYKSIANALEESTKAATDALAKVVEAETNTNGLAIKSEQSMKTSADLLKTAADSHRTVVNELKTNMTKAQRAMASINDSLTANIEMNRKAEDRTNLIRPGQKETADSVSNDAKEVQKSIKETEDKVNVIASKIPEMSEKSKKIVKTSSSGGDNVKSAKLQVDSQVPKGDELKVGLDVLKKNVDSVSVLLANVTSLVHSLRLELAKARDVANRIKVGAHFYANSSLQLHNPDRFSRTSAYSLISLYFKTNERNGLLFFLGNEIGTHRSHGVPTDDYMALEIEDEKVKLTYDLGSGVSPIYSSTRVSNGQWYKVTIERTGKLAILTVDGVGLVTDRNEGFSLGTKSVLNLHQETSKFYIGGVPDSAKLPRHVGNRHFVGQIEEVNFHGQPLGLWNYALNGQTNIYPASGLQPSITATGIQMSGEGYLELHKGDWVPRLEANIALSFKTIALNGLLFYVGKDKDYVSIEIRNGKVYCHYNVGSGKASLTTTTTYNDGELHTIEFSRKGRNATLIMDMDNANALETTARIGHSDLDVSNSYFIGGLKEPLSHDQNVTRQSFYGCIDKLKLNDVMVNLNDPKSVKSAAFVEVGCPKKPIRLVSFEPQQPGAVQFSQRLLSSKIEVTFKFKTRQKNALILLVADNVQHNAFAVTLESGTLVVSDVNNGNNASSSRLKMEYKDYADGMWHYVTATIHDRVLKLECDDMFTEIGELNHVSTFAEGEVTLYFGQIQDQQPLTRQLSDRSPPFIGCIGDVTFNQKLLDFMNATRTSYGISLVGCPLAEFVPVTSDATDGSEESSGNMMLENATSLYPWRPTPSPLDSCALDFGPIPTVAPNDVVGTRFGLEAFSRLEFDRLPDTFDTKGEFSIQFRASAANGLLFYATNKKRTDFITLYMKNGYLVFSFDSGSGPLSLTTKRRYMDYHWHTAIAWRDGRNASVSVDNIIEVRGEAAGTTFAVDTHSPFYVGGLPQDLVPFSKKTISGVVPIFGGCLRDFKLNGLELPEPRSVGTKQCSDTMENGLFFGPNGGYVILQDQLTVGTTFSFEMEMKPRVKDAILLSVSSPDPKGDYLVLQMLDGHVKFTVDNGDGQHLVNLSLGQPNSICDGHWHNVKIYKTKNLITMSVDGISKFFVIKVKSTETNTKDPLYLGGVPSGHLNRGLETNENFRGCIRNVVIGKKPRRKKDLDMRGLRTQGDVTFGLVCPVS